MDEIGASFHCQITNVADCCWIELTFTWKRIRGDSLIDGLLVKLQIRVLRVGKNAEDTRMAGSSEAASEIEDHRLGPVHSATTDYLQDFHVQSAPGPSFSFLYDSRRPTTSRRPSFPGTSWLPSLCCIDVATSTIPCFAAEAKRVSSWPTYPRRH